MIHKEPVFITMLAWQVLVTVVVGALFFFLKGKHAAISALLGGSSVIFAATFASLIFVRNKNKQDAGSILIRLILSEIVKLTFVFTFLFLVFKHYKSLFALALIIGLISAAMVSGVAMAKMTKAQTQ